MKPSRANQRDVSYWKALIPDLTIGAERAVKEVSFSSKKLSEIADDFWERGYFSLPPVLTPSNVKQLEEAMIRLNAQGIPPVYIYLYDQHWQLFAELNGLLRHFLGDSFAVLPNLWAWHLDKPGHSGWPLHRDCDAETVFNVEKDRLLMSLSLWIPLTETDENNGCMRVLPRTESEALQQQSEYSPAFLSEKSVSLPAKAGAVLGWAQDIYHWGGNYTDAATGPRISLSLEFQNMSFEPLADPLINLSDLPDFDQRLSSIESQFSKYRHMETEQSA
ncbi:MAG: phytanoyl-CoA dioxygenase family protein [Proteobacteria bacterium]|nr:phytanoyl-CoA dioxygenase family protein [Pseudomonadota bacterium]